MTEVAPQSSASASNPPPPAPAPVEESKKPISPSPEKSPKKDLTLLDMQKARQEYFFISYPSQSRKRCTIISK